MTILNIKTDSIGLVGVEPRVVYIETNNTVAEITATGFLNSAVKDGFSFNTTDIASVSTSAVSGQPANATGWYTISKSGSNWTLTAASGGGGIPTIGSSTNDAFVRWDGTSGEAVANSVVTATDAGIVSGITQLNVDNVRVDGNTISTTNTNGNLDIDLDGTGQFKINSSTAGITDILDEDDMISDSPTALATQQSIKAYVDNNSGGSITLPTVAGQLAHFTDTTGTLADTASAVVNLGNITAGASGTAGYIESFPGTASKGSLRMVGVANTGDTVTTISNAAMGQATTISIPDPGASTGQFGVTTGALVDNNIITADGTAGRLQDSGIAISSVLSSSSIFYEKEDFFDLSPLGAGPFTIPVTGCTTSSVALATVGFAENDVYIKWILPGTNEVQVTFNADVGTIMTFYLLVFL